MAALPVAGVWNDAWYASSMKFRPVPLMGD